MGTTASTVEPNAPPKRISPPLPQSIGESAPTMSLAFEPQTQDDLSHEALMGLHELDTHLSLLDDPAAVSPKEQATPISLTSSSISNKNDSGIHTSIETSFENDMITKRFARTETLVPSISSLGRPKKMLKTFKYVA